MSSNDSFRHDTPNLALNPDPACIAFRSLSTTRFLGFVQRLGAGGARLASFVRPPMVLHGNRVPLAIPMALISLACYSQSKPMNLKRGTKVVAFGEALFSGLKGTPTKHMVEKVENTHVEGQIDEWHTLEYPGIKLKYYRVVPEKRNILRSLELVSADYVLPFGIRIGATRKSITAILGKPSTSGPDVIEYECGDLFSQTVSFEFKDDHLRAIQWDNEID
jgi:hypothetical protein